MLPAAGSRRGKRANQLSMCLFLIVVSGKDTMWQVQRASQPTLYLEVQIACIAHFAILKRLGAFEHNTKALKALKMH